MGTRSKAGRHRVYKCPAEVLRILNPRMGRHGLERTENRAQGQGWRGCQMWVQAKEEGDRQDPWREPSDREKETRCGPRPVHPIPARGARCGAQSLLPAGQGRRRHGRRVLARAGEDRPGEMTGARLPHLQALQVIQPPLLCRMAASLGFWGPILSGDIAALPCSTPAHCPLVQCALSSLLI